MTPSSSLPSPYPGAGEVIDGKYQIEKILGEGGMGCVARAFHLLLRAPVALKFMNPQFMTFPGAVERFINEGIASKRIRSDHVVPVDDVGKLATGAPYLVMPCLEGMDLADLLARDGAPGVPVERAVHFTLQILRGLQAAHAAGIIHRDMKPSNCFVVKHDGERDFVKILDFGISKVVQAGSASLTQTNSALGTPLYMSPEQARSPRDVDARSDIYSVGIILYELLSGHTPFSSDTGEFTEILFKLFTTEPPPIKSTLPDLDDALAAAVHKALAREVADRYPTAAEMAEALAPFSDSRSAQVLTRIRGFSPDQAVSLPPPADMPLPPSMVAFSALDVRPQTDVMANRPTTDVVNAAPVTAMMANAPGQIPATPQVPKIAYPESGSIRLSATPDTSAATDPTGAVARTQYGATTGLSAQPKPGASTDLGAARDAQPSGAPEPRRSPLVWAFPLLALVGFGIGASALLSHKGDTASPDSAKSTTAANQPPSIPASVTVAPSASAASATPSAAPSASASATPSAHSTQSARPNNNNVVRPPSTNIDPLKLGPQH